MNRNDGHGEGLAETASIVGAAAAIPPHLLHELLLQLRDPTVVVHKDPERTIRARIRQIDAQLSSQLDEILHHPDLLRLEGSWRGLRFLVERAKTSPSLQIRVLDVSKGDLQRDLDPTIDFEEGALASLLLPRRWEYSTLFGVLLGDYDFSHEVADVALLEHLSNVAARIHAPFVAAASPAIFRRASFRDVSWSVDQSGPMALPEYDRWNAFRRSGNARYAALVLPRVLARVPYGHRRPVAEFDYRERADGPETAVWSHAVYAYGTLLAEAFHRFGWFAAIRGVESGGLVDGIATFDVDSESGQGDPVGPCEVWLDDRKDVELERLGFIAFLPVKTKGAIVAFTAASCQVPASDEHSGAARTAGVGVGLDLTLCASRFAHLVTAETANCFNGAYMGSREVEAWLSSRLETYCRGSGMKETAADVFARPLEHAHARVCEVEGRPGHRRVELAIEPRAQMHGRSARLRLVFDLLLA